MTTVINNWAKILDNRGQVDTFIFDFVKAFDTPPRRARNQHSKAFQTPIANADVYNFFPQTIRDCNALPDSLTSSAKDAEDCVAKITSLVRARD